MIFPKSTEYNKALTKKFLMSKLSMTPALSKGFGGIKKVTWKYKLSPDTIHLDSGEIVSEIQVFEIKLNQKELDENVLRQIDRQIPYHILFLLEYEGLYQAWIAYKQGSKNSSSSMKVDQYFHTEWLAEQDLPIKIDGLNLDKVYENFVRQIAGNQLHSKSSASKESLKEDIELSKEIQKLEKKISTVQKKLKNEKQLNRRMEINQELKSLKHQLEEMKYGKNEDGVR